MKTFLGYLSELEFFIKVALACALVQQGFYRLFAGRHVAFAARVVIVWAVGSAAYYVGGYLIESVLKKSARVRAARSTRVVKVKPQPYPSFTAKGILVGELRSLLVTSAILAVAPQVRRGDALLPNVAWFLFSIVVSDLLFYGVHRALHLRALRWVHIKHHEFRDTSSWIAAHKSPLESLLVTVLDVTPIFLLGYDLSQLCAWTLIGTLYNLEGHSALSIFFISSDFHDLHHTAFHGNYGIGGLWDRVFGTLNPPTRKAGALFPVASLEARAARQSLDHGVPPTADRT